MNLKSESVEFDGVKYTTQQYPAVRAFRLLTRLMKSVGPSLFALGKMDPNAELEMGGEALATALGNLDPNEATALLPEILGGTTALVPDATGGRDYPLLKHENIDMVFSGRLNVMFKVLGHALKVNFGNFSLGGGGAVTPSPSPLAK